MKKKERLSVIVGVVKVKFLDVEVIEFLRGKYNCIRVETGNELRIYTKVK